MGCGRHFQIKGFNSDYKAHTALCDGSAPIAAVEEVKEAASVKEANVADLNCGKCGREFKHGKRKETHEATCDGTAKPARKAAVRKPRRSTRPSSNGLGGGVLAGALDSLKAKRQELIAGIPELAQVDKAIAALELLGGGGDLKSHPRRRKDHDGSVEEDPDLP